MDSLPCSECEGIIETGLIAETPLAAASVPKIEVVQEDTAADAAPRDHPLSAPTPADAPKVVEFCSPVGPSPVAPDAWPSLCNDCTATTAATADDATPWYVVAKGLKVGVFQHWWVNISTLHSDTLVELSPKGRTSHLLYSKNGAHTIGRPHHRLLPSRSSIGPVNVGRLQY